MIRNWVGMTNNKAFYEAADKYGILIWDDFWLANPADGPNPDNETMFLDNAVDKIKKNRYHAALVLYCGRNESAPPKTLDSGLKQRTRDYDGTRIYFPITVQASRSISMKCRMSRFEANAAFPTCRASKA
jgi:beta-galactosidase/beta-glucuronidase